jgi:hypothetical protein
MLTSARCGLHKKPTGARYTQLVFLHQVGCVGHVVHFGASGARKVIALLFMLGWDRYGFEKKRAWTSYAKPVFLCPVGYAGRVVHSGVYGAQIVDAS